MVFIIANIKYDDLMSTSVVKNYFLKYLKYHPNTTNS